MSVVVGRDLADSFRVKDAAASFRVKSGSFKHQVYANNQKTEAEINDVSNECLCFDEAENFVFDSVYVHFDLSVFVHQFILHMLLPFSIWMSPSPKAQLLWFDRDLSWGAALGNTFILALNMTAFVSIISYEFMPMEDRIHYFGAVAYPILFSTMWRLSVATKYAMFSPTEYKKILTFKSWAINDAYYDQTLINTNLIDYQNDHVNRFEIAAGAHRADVTNVDSIKFMIENPDNSLAAKMRLDEWHHFLMCTTPELKMKDALAKVVEKSVMNDVTLGTDTIIADRMKAAQSSSSPSNKQAESSKKLKKEKMLGPDGFHFNLQKQDDGSYALCLFDLCRHVQIWAHQEATKELNTNLYRMSMCVVIVITLIPFFTCIDGSYHISDHITIVFLAFTSFDCLFFLRTVFARFMMGAIIDYRRQLIMQRAFHDLLRTSDFDNEIRFTMEGHWKFAQQKSVKEKNEEVHEYQPRYGAEEKLNNHAVKIFHSAGKSEIRKRRATLERNPVAAAGIRDMLHQIRESEGEGKSDIENMLNADDSEAEIVLSQRLQASQSNHLDQHHAKDSHGRRPMTIEHFDEALHLHASSKSNSTVGGATPEHRNSFDSPEANKTKYVNYLKDNYYANTMYTSRVEPHTTRGPTEASHMAFPRLSMEYDSNIFSWVQARQVMSTFKIRFRRRIEVVAGIFFLATMGSIIGCLATIYSSANIAAAYNTPLVLQTIVIVTSFAIALMKYVTEASRINDMFERQKMSIRKHQMKIHSMIAHCQTLLTEPEIRQKLEVKNNALEACAQFIETANHNEPCEVFGIKAEGRLTVTILSGLISFYITLISIYYYNGGEKTYQRVTGTGA